jgi:hypothetical protein
MAFKYPHNEKVKELLKDYADFVQKDGLNYLIPNWQRFADKYADTEDTLDEWLNDLDTRKIIDEVIEVLSEKDRRKIELDLKPIDAKVIEKTFEINECVWGGLVEKNSNYNRRKHWYYYRMNQKVFANQGGQFTRTLNKQ